MSDIIDQLRTAMFERLSVARSGARSTGLTVGVEQEFFLLSGSTAPCSHVQSQDFLSDLADLPGWSLGRTTSNSGNTFIEEVMCSNGGAVGTRVKYDHHPHLLEVATRPCQNLHELLAQLEGTWAAVRIAAARNKLSPTMMPVLPVRASDHRLLSPLPLFRSLRHYRSILFRRRGQYPDADSVNYAAVVAATQTHVGGLPWTDDASLVESLYVLEPFLLGPVAQSASDECTSAITELLWSRWHGYLAVFEGYPLVGFPPGDGWSVETWLVQLSESPLAGGPVDAWAGKTLAEIGGPPDGDWNRFFAAVRDLQIIRPRLFGTLEFRADPAQPSVQAVLAVAALRLGLCSAILEGATRRVGNYQKARQQWLDGVRRGFIVTDPHLRQLAESGLRSRGIREEEYLGARFPLFTNE